MLAYIRNWIWPQAAAIKLPPKGTALFPPQGQVFAVNRVGIITLASGERFMLKAQATWLDPDQFEAKMDAARIAMNSGVTISFPTGWHIENITTKPQ
jgi:hypothetical protein